MVETERERSGGLTGGGGTEYDLLLNELPRHSLAIRSCTKSRVGRRKKAFEPELFKAKLGRASL